MNRNWFVPIAFLLLVDNGCEKKAEKHEAAKEAAHSAKTEVQTAQADKEEFQKKMEHRLKNLEAEIAKLREKGRDLKGDSLSEWDRKIAALNTKLDTARTRLSEVAHNSAEAWNDLQKNAQAAWDDVEKAFENVH